jgi:hypothetical protein
MRRSVFERGGRPSADGQVPRGRGRKVLPLAAIGAIAAIASVVVLAPSAKASTTLLGWTATADANPLDIVVDNSSGLSGVHPVSEVDIPEAYSDYETGFGHGLASIAWPGGTLGNFGSLSGELGLPAPLAAITAKLNDPVRAESFYPSGPAEATYPSGSTNGLAEMESKATGDGTSAKSGLADVSVATLLTAQGLQGSSNATAGNTANATSTGSFSSLSLLGGLITIGATTSTATASSDGQSPFGTAATHIGAITIAGHSVSVGSDGIVVGPAQTNVLGVTLGPTVAQVNQLIAALNLKIVPLPVDETRQGTVESISSGGLRLSMALPSSASTTLDCSALPSQLSQLSVLCTLPGELQGATMTLTLARSTATAIASLPFNLGGGTGGGIPPVTVPVSLPTSSGGSGQTSSPSSTTGQAATTTGQGPSIAGGSTAPTTSAGNGSSGLGSIAPVSLSRPVKAGLLIFLLVLAGAVGAGLVRMGRHLEDPVADTICPLDQESE